MKVQWIAALLTLAVVTGAPSVMADFVLEDAGSVAKFNLPGDPSFSPADRSELFFSSRLQTKNGAVLASPLHDASEQSYWYRKGATGPEARVSSLSLDFVSTFDTNGNGDDDRIRYAYSGDGLKFTSTQTLRGGLVGTGYFTNYQRVMVIQNTTAAPVSMSFFSYNDWTLTNGPGIFPDDDLYPDWGQIFNDGRRVRFFDLDNGPDGAFDLDVLNSVMVTEVGPTPTHFEIGPVGTPTDIFTRLGDGAATTLLDIADNGVGGPIRSADTTSDLDFALQWDFTLGPFGTYVVVENTLITPEPGLATIMTVLGTMTLMSRRARRRVAR